MGIYPNEKIKPKMIVAILMEKKKNLIQLNSTKTNLSNSN